MSHDDEGMSRSSDVARNLEAQLEESKIGMTALAEDLAQGALSGKVRGAIVLLLMDDGQIQTRYIGVHPAMAYGALEFHAEIIKRKNTV